MNYSPEIDLNKEVWGYKEVSAFTGFTVKTLISYRSKKKILFPPTIYPNGHPKWFRNDIIAFFKGEYGENTRRRAGRPRNITSYLSF